MRRFLICNYLVLSLDAALKLPDVWSRRQILRHNAALAQHLTHRRIIRHMLVRNRRLSLQVRLLDIVVGHFRREVLRGNRQSWQEVCKRTIILDSQLVVSMGSDPMEEKCSQLCRATFIPLPCILPFPPPSNHRPPCTHHNNIQGLPTIQRHNSSPAPSHANIRTFNADIDDSVM